MLLDTVLYTSTLLVRSLSIVEVFVYQDCPNVSYQACLLLIILLIAYYLPIAYYLYLSSAVYPGFEVCL